MDLRALGIGDKSPAIVNAVIEIPLGSQNKYEYDPPTNSMRLDRVLPVFFSYPTDYGFIPETLSGDGDHLDALVIKELPSITGSAVKVRVIGALEMTDEKGQDYKIVGVIDGDEKMGNVLDITDLNPTLLDKISHFFEDYKKLENTKFSNVGHFKNKDFAIKEILQSHKAYLKNR
jgi:inorganic pyrophosphatase